MATPQTSPGGGKQGDPPRGSLRAIYYKPAFPMIAWLVLWMPISMLFPERHFPIWLMPFFFLAFSAPSDMAAAALFWVVFIPAVIVGIVRYRRQPYRRQP